MQDELCHCKIDGSKLHYVRLRNTGKTFYSNYCEGINEKGKPHGTEICIRRIKEKISSDSLYHFREIFAKRKWFKLFIWSLLGWNESQLYAKEALDFYRKSSFKVKNCLIFISIFLVLVVFVLLFAQLFILGRKVEAIPVVGTYVNEFSVRFISFLHRCIMIFSRKES